MHTREMLESMKAKEVRDVAQGLKVPKYWTRKKSELIESILKLEAQKVLEDKKERIQRAEEGLLLAYRYQTPKGQFTGTAKIIVNNRAMQELTIETRLGSRFTIDYNQVIWVKTGRWPKGVLEELKRGNNHEKK